MVDGIECFPQVNENRTGQPTNGQRKEHSYSLTTSQSLIEVNQLLSQSIDQLIDQSINQSALIKKLAI